jgi:hypothetical protein
MQLLQPTIPLLTALPATPVDGQIIAFQVDATNGVVWMFRYNAASASPLKWEFIGGSPYVSAVAAQDTITSTSYADAPTNPGPGLNMPAAFTNGGDYVVTITGQLIPAVSQYVVMGAKFGAAALADDQAAITSGFSTAGSNFAQSRTMRRNLAAGQVLIKCQYGVSGGSATVLRREMLVTPVRVG